MLCRKSGALAAALLLSFSFAAACGDDGTGGSGGTAGGGSDTGGNETNGGGGNETNGGGGQGGTTNGGGGQGGTTDGGGGSGGAECPVLDTGCEVSLENICDLPTLLSETGLYSDIGTGEIASYIRPYTPKYQLWSDDAVKTRYAYIPECAQIDNSDPDTWQVPVGSRFWKEFVRDGNKIETRLIVRTGPGETDFEFGTYVWNGNDAVRNDNGVIDDVGHNDIPPKTLCSGCHKRQWRILGFSGLQLTHSIAGSETMASLSADDVLTDPDPDGIVVPGDATVEPALGYLHANCGNCHYQGGISNIDMHLRILSSMTTPETTDTYLTTIDVQPTMFDCVNNPGCDIVEPGPGGAALSALIERMSSRPSNQMPPFATEVVDTNGVALVSAWIESLP